MHVSKVRIVRRLLWLVEEDHDGGADGAEALKELDALVSQDLVYQNHPQRVDPDLR